MKVLRSIVTEIIGLFVDDWVFALLLVGWVVVFSHLHGHSPSAPFVFVGGIAVLTLVFIQVKARAVAARR